MRLYKHKMANIKAIRRRGLRYGVRVWVEAWVVWGWYVDVGILVFVVKMQSSLIWPMSFGHSSNRGFSGSQTAWLNWTSRSLNTELESRKKRVTCLHILMCQSRRTKWQGLLVISIFAIQQTEPTKEVETDRVRHHLWYITALNSYMFTWIS